jgi:hypothetical protein
MGNSHPNEAPANRNARASGAAPWLNRSKFHCDGYSAHAQVKGYWFDLNQRPVSLAE